MKAYMDIPYSAHGYDECKLDLMLPESDSFPIFVYFHGGGLEHGDKKCKVFGEYLTNMGIAVASANYRMYPSAKYPDFLEDSAEAVAWVLRNIGKYGNCEGVYVGGGSAGGFISMMLCFDKRWYDGVGVSPEEIRGYVHDAGQPTAHFNVLRERGIDTRRVIVDDSAPLFHIGEQKSYPDMLFIVSDNDMKNRYEQTILTLSTLKHFGHEEKTTLKVMNGKHCAYVGRIDEDGKSAFGKMVEEFIVNHR